MSDFKPIPQKNKKTTNIVLLIVFSVLLFVAIAGIFNRLAQGENELSEYIPNIILIPISTFFVIRTSLVLKGRIRTLQISWTLIMDVGVMAMFVFCACGMIALFIDSLSKAKVGPLIFSMVLFAGFIWAMYLWIKISKAHWALFSLAFAPSKNPQKKKDTLVTRLISVEQLLYITDAAVNSNIPYVDEDGLLNIYDSRDLAEKVITPLGFYRNIPSYIIKVIDKKERIECFQKLYDSGFRTIQYVTSMGSIDLLLEDFPINRTDDPVHHYSSQFLIQNYVAMQHRARFAHLKEIGRSEAECSAALSVATAQTNISVATFYSSIFYTFVVPDNIDADNVLNFSKDAFDVCTEKDLISNMSFDNVTRRMVYSGSITTPYLDRNRQQKLFMLVFTRFEKAREYLDEVKSILTKWEVETPEEEKMNAIQYWNRLKGLSACDICVMTGKEIAIHMIHKKCEFVAINHEQDISRNAIEGYIADSANSFQKG